MKSRTILLTLIFAAIAPAGANAQQQPEKPAQPAAAAAPAPAPKLTPKQQITSFYSTCKQGRGGEGLMEMLSGNPVVKKEDVQRVADAFQQMIAEMGAFVDFGISKETKVSDRVQVVRCVAHFERQPFINEFTFYDPGAGQWRLVHLRYDANLATMFGDEMRGAAEAK